MRRAQGSDCALRHDDPLSGTPAFASRRKASAGLLAGAFVIRQGTQPNLRRREAITSDRVRCRDAQPQTVT